MHHPVLFVIGMFLLARLVIRARMRRRWALAGGGGCGGGHCNRAIDLGAPDGDTGGRHARRWARWGRRHHWRQELRTAQKPNVDVIGALELNQRQREIYDETVAKAKQKLQVAQLAEALSLVGEEPFDREAVEGLVGRGELADDFEQLHFSLTPEQRAKLRDVASA